MSVLVGDILEGKVSGITKFGAFVNLSTGDNGLVHISEISKSYVEKVEDFLKKNDSVKVKVLSVGNDGKISLSIRQAEEIKNKKPIIKPPKEVVLKEPEKDLSFEDMMSKFLKDSNDRFDDIKARDGKRGFGQRLKTKNTNY